MSHRDLTSDLEQGVQFSLKELRFVEHYLQTGSIPKATRLAGYRLPASGYRLYARPDVRAAIAARREELIAQLGVTTDRILAEQAAIAFLDIRKIFAPDGTILPVSQWPDEAAAAVTSIDTEETTQTGPVPADCEDCDPPLTRVRTHKVRFASKGDALDKLMRHLGMYAKDNAQAPAAFGDSLGDRMASAFERVTAALQARRATHELS